MSRNINWTDSKVFGASQQPNASNAGVMGFSYEKPKQQVSPATYAEPKQQNSDVAGAQYAEPSVSQNVAGAQYVEPSVSQNVAGAQYTDPKQGVAGAQYADPKQGVAGAGSGYPGGFNSTPQSQTLTQTPPMAMTTMPADFTQGPPPVTSPGYIPGYLRSLIGQPVRAEFLIGSNLLTDRTGFVREVGVNYFVLEDIVTRSRVMCDLYSVKFVTSL